MAEPFLDAIQSIFGQPAQGDPLAYPRGAAQSGTIMGTLDHLMGRPTNEQLGAQLTTDLDTKARAERDGVRRAAADKEQTEIGRPLSWPRHTNACWPRTEATRTWRYVG